MAYDIGAQIGINGEKEFDQALKTINSQIKVLQSEMKASVTAMAGMDDAEASVTQQTNILGREIDVTQQKISVLSTQYDRAKATLSTLNTELQEAVQKFGENSKEASKAQNAYNRQAQSVNELGTKLNNAQADLNKLNNKLSELTTDSRKAADGVDDLGDSLDEAGNSAGGLGSKISEAFTGGAVAGAVSSLIDGMQSLIDSTSEYTRVMGTLETSSQRAGYTAEETAQTYNQLYGVLGDTQTAATAAANLQALGLEQSELTKLTDYAIGAWATYGDSIPIDSLAESINETIRAGQVTGTFADALNWAGTSEDEFNEKLAAAGSESERVNLVMQELAKQGLGETAEAWRENNAELLASREATASFNEAMAEVAQMVMPIITALQSGLASVITTLINLVTIGQTQGIGQMLATMNTALAENLPQMLQNGIQQATSFLNGIVSMIPQVLETALTVMATLVEGILSQIPEIINSAVEIVTNLLNEITNHLPEILDKGIEILHNIIDGIIGAIPSLIAALPQVISAIISFIVQNLPVIFQKGWEILVEIGNGIVAAIGELLSPITSVVQAIVDGFTDSAQSFLDIGKNIVEGVWDGISGAASWLQEKVSGFFSGIVSGIKGILGIGSPSRVMATEVGLPMAQGIGVGIRNGEKSVLDAADDVNSALLKQEKAFAKEYSNLDLTKDISARMTTSVQRLTVDDLNRATAAAVNGITTGSAVQTQSVIQIPIYLDSRQIAQATYDPLRGIARQRGETYG